MNINRPLMPGFLKKAEQNLLLNYPLVWSTRVHLVLYYGILYNLLLAGVSLVAPMELLGRSEAGYWAGFEIIVAIIAVTIWLIYLLRFNVFKKYGNVKPLHALVTFLLYFISTGIIVLSVFIYPIIECVRANRAIGDKELVQDINNMNLKLSRLEYKVLSRAWNYDTVVVLNNKKSGEFTPQHGNNVNDDGTSSGGHALYTLDTATFQNKLATSDTLRKLNDTMYLMYNIPELQFVSSYNVVDYTSEKLLTSSEIYNSALKQPPTAAELPAIEKELEQLKNKYRVNDYGYSDEIEPTDAPFAVVRKKHHLGNINNNIEHLVSKKYNFSGRSLAISVRLFYYFTLVISLLIFIFRHTTTRAFFLALLSGVLLTIFTAMMLSLSGAGSVTFTGWMIVYTLLFFTGSLFTFSLTKRSMLNGILINLFTFIIPVLPLLVVDLMYELNKEPYYRTHGTDYWSEAAQYFLYAEIGGAVLLLVLLATYLNKVYRRWYSLPEN